MVQVTFLGTGAAFSNRRRTNVALLVNEQEGDTDVVTNFLIECGPTILYQLERAGLAVTQIDHLFISHRHGDHFLGLPMFLLLRSFSGVSKPLSIHASEEVIQAGQELMRLVFPEFDGRLEHVEWVETPADRPAQAQLGPSLHFSTLPTVHSRHVSSLALRLDFANDRSLVYTGDTAFNERLVELAQGCDLLVHESNYSETLQPEVKPDTYGGHSTAYQAGRIAAMAGCKILALVHLSPAYAGREGEVRAEAMRAFDGPVIIPSDGATLYL